MARATNPARVAKLLDRVWPKHEIQKSGQEHMVQCPFCASDKAKCAINPEKGVFQCWVCGERGPTMKLMEHLKLLKVISAADVEAIRSGNVLVRLSNTITSLVKPTPKKDVKYWSDTVPCVVPPHCYRLEGFQPKNLIQTRMQAHVEAYLLGRGLTMEEIYKYRLYFCCKPGSVYHGHVVIPALGKHGRQLVYWTTRSTLPNPQPKSLHAGSKYSRFSAKNILLNEHLVVGTTVALCEGPFDAWAIMNATKIPACPLLGKQLHKYQKDVLLEKGVTEVYVCLDPDARDAQARISRDFIRSGIQPRLVLLEDGDPNDVPPKKLYAAFEQAAYSPHNPFRDLCDRF